MAKPLLIFLFTLIGSAALAQFPLQMNWQVSDATQEQWHAIGNAETVHADLLEKGIIANPYFAANEERCAWVANKDWKYRSEPFNFSAEDLQKDHIDLVFRELDTFAEVSFNGTPLFTGENYFRTYRADVKSLVRTTGNVIEIVFRSPVRVGNALLQQQAHPLPGDPIRAVARKPQYHYGWDWGPKLITSGLGQNIQIHAWNDFRVESVKLETISIGDTAVMQLIADVYADTSFDLEWALALNGNNEVVTRSGSIRLVGGKSNQITTTLHVPNPALWYPNGYGEAYLYKYTFKATSEREKHLTAGKTGIRAVEWITTPDSLGNRFAFKINEKEVFARGANYIPQDLIYRNDPAKELALLQVAKDAHMNMLRIWGGGKYESDRFYNRCDSLGIMVWQDFMFACAMYPGDDDFLLNVREEAEEQVQRIGQHPSVVLWCGNNESSEGWERWGWKSGLSNKETAAVQASYDRLFKELLPEIVAQGDDVGYHESSPTFGRGDARFKITGDAHDWGIWHDGYAFDSLETRVPRFMSEFGFQSFPNPITLMDFCKPGDIDSTNAKFRNHEKHPRGFSIIQNYMTRMYPPVQRFDDWLYMSQIVQRDGIIQGIRAHRLAWPYCGGTLYWQFNDCWPVASWSSIDYNMHPKALQHALPNAFKPFTAFFKQRNGETSVVVSNLGEPGERHSLSVEGILDGEKVILLDETNSFEVGASTFKLNREVFDALVLRIDGAPVDYLFAPTLFGGALPYMEYVQKKGEWHVMLQTDEVIRDLRLDAGIPGRWSENFITMMPGEQREVIFYPTRDADIPVFSMTTLGSVFAE